MDVRLFAHRSRGGAEHAPRNAPAAAARRFPRAPGPPRRIFAVQDKLALSRSPYPGAAALLDDCAAAAADEIIARAGGPAWDEQGFARLAEAARSGLSTLTAQVITGVARVLAEAHEVEVVLARAAAHADEPAFADIRTQFASLDPPRFYRRHRGAKAR